MERDLAAALSEAKHIDKYNDKRKDVDRQMTDEITRLLSGESQKHQNSIVLYDEHWKKGVIGIATSRLTEIYYRPTIVITREGDLATGSARTAASFDLYAAIESCSDLLINFGGHTYAAGLTLRWENVKISEIVFKSMLMNI